VRASLDSLIESERECCSFLDFSVEADAGELVVEVVGPTSARPLIDRLFAVEPERPDRRPRAPFLGAIGAALALVACCALAPALIGAAWALKLAAPLEIALGLAAVGAAFVAVRRHRARRCC
jgi:hypothetical protein